MQLCPSGGVCSSFLCRDQLPLHQPNFAVRFSSEEGGKTVPAVFPWPCVHFLVLLALNRCVYKVIDLVS